ncbi:putative protein {ECO:0000313/EMBL:AAB84937,1} [Methanothermobacter wolfeii]|mgnify:CR=1 FL=1|uniref:Uncharacterized protein n=1 Tax=Methanothermobacter wolfeii TaxID=145261 RepID=A0A9E7RVN2_METWO|nr:MULTISPECIES: hypothetical protein [Methanothermobacter]NLM02886.1 hypothetical protein [Methanothermobacter wolfeii]QHN07204.1 hypothetical protein FZP57_03900 [Methanothermobacter sp. THM-1]UXH32611.1 hypothetical protein N5910_04225 [Methanothermobacter wolfeii]SCM56981.1 putative protein {ECO:0000313/EMBL:AAB84937,1} [Methanothermobacter wolfeii]
MDTLTVIVMLALFILLLGFIFSAGLMTPVIGKKNIFFVIFIGFIAGVIGGIFLISPVYDELPFIVRNIYMSTSDVNETITADVSAGKDILRFMDELSAQDGVEAVYSEGIFLKTDRFSESRKRIIEDKISLIDPNITSWQVHTNGTIILQVKKGHNPVRTLDTLSEWLMYTGGINTCYSAVHLVVTVRPDKVDSIVSYLQARDVVVTGIKGPAEEKAAAFKAALPDKSNIILFCGFLGMLTGIAGVFIDSIIAFIGKIRGREA